MPRPFLNVPSDETTGSLNYTDLTTPDTTSFTLPVAATVSVIYKAVVYKDDCGGTLFDIIHIDGVEQVGSRSAVSLSNGDAATLPTMFTSVLPAGRHTVTVKHKVDTCPAHWVDRTLVVLIQ